MFNIRPRMKLAFRGDKYVEPIGMPALQNVFSMIYMPMMPMLMPMVRFLHRFPSPCLKVRHPTSITMRYMMMVMAAMTAGGMMPTMMVSLGQKDSTIIIRAVILSMRASQILLSSISPVV